MQIVISSGHGKHVRGASGYLDEVNEARKVVEQLANYLFAMGIGVVTFHDDTSTSQSQNLDTIVNYHNMQTRNLDVSVHFNAYQTTSKPMGTEVLYLTQQDLAAEVSKAIATAGRLPNRGAKKRSDLAFLNGTDEPAILIEVCFVDSSADANLYRTHFKAICKAIADVARPTDPETQVHNPAPIPDNQTNIVASVFGGASDYNVSAYDEDKVLNDSDLYIALPDRFSEERPEVRIFNRESGQSAVAEIWDVGPWNTDDPYWDKGTRPQAECGTDMTGRTTNGAGIDLSPALAKALKIDGMGTVDWEFVS
jgi:N-acetylmuramoyl-L-alanine amidase